MSSKVKRLLIIGGIAALFLITLFIIIRWQRAQELAKPPPSSKPVSLNYTNTKYSFALKFPRTWWYEEPVASIVTLTGPTFEGCDYPAFMHVTVIEELSAEVLSGTLEDYVVKFEESLKDAKNYKRVELKPATVSNQPAQELTWSMSVMDPEKTLLLRQAFFFKDKSVFVITYTSLEEFNDLYASAFDLVTTTFRFY